MRLDERLHRAARTCTDGRCFRIAVLAAVVMGLLAIVARADARVGCDSGTTAVVDGRLRIFGVYSTGPAASSRSGATTSTRVRAAGGVPHSTVLDGAGGGEELMREPVRMVRR